MKKYNFVQILGNKTYVKQLKQKYYKMNARDKGLDGTVDSLRQVLNNKEQFGTALTAYQSNTFIY